MQLDANNGQQFSESSWLKENTVYKFTNWFDDNLFVVIECLLVACEVYVEIAQVKSNLYVVYGLFFLSTLLHLSTFYVPYCIYPPYFYIYLLYKANLQSK